MNINKSIAPVLSSNVISETTFGEFHPTAQIRAITDYSSGGIFKGKDFDLHVTRVQARRYMELTEKMKPNVRVEIDKTIMKDKLFAVEVFKMCE